MCLERHERFSESGRSRAKSADKQYGRNHGDVQSRRGNAA